ncbi:MAG: hypothetical protein K8I82_17780 [Anaerolineae bacterium]|nr:hypothetical protein [Anaerolineae bacterium]
MSIAEQLLETGILQFGEFQVGDGRMPFRLEFGLLPAYPTLLGQLAAVAATLTRPLSIDRLLVAADMLPFGTAVSLQTNIPLVYNRGQGESPAHDMVGAYDSGHSALLVMNVLYKTAPVMDMIRRARQVGLQTNTVLSIVDLGAGQIPTPVQRLSIISFSDLINTLADRELLPPGQINAVRHWSEKQSA